MGEKSQSLAQAVLDIDSLCRNPFRSAQEKKFLKDIKQCIHAIHVAHRGWIKAGVINDYYAQQDQYYAIQRLNPNEPLKVLTLYQIRYELREEKKNLLAEDKLTKEQEASLNRQLILVNSTLIGMQSNKVDSAKVNENILKINGFREKHENLKKDISQQQAISQREQPSAFSQDALIEECIETQVKSKKFTHLALRQLYDYLDIIQHYRLTSCTDEQFNDLIKSKEISLQWANKLKHLRDTKPKFIENKAFKHHLDVLMKHVDAVIQDLKNSENETNDNTKLTSSEEDLFHADDESLLGLYSLGGRYFPFRQDSDPLMDANFDGICSRLVTVWQDEISKHGRFISQFRMDEETLSSTQNEKSFKIFMYLLHSFDQGTDLKKTVTKLIDNMDESNTYILSVSAGRDERHALGIRKIPQTNEVEFFDPNFGIFVLPENAMKSWLAAFICDEYHSMLKNNGNLIYLHTGKSQPKNSKASIPLLKEQHECTETDLQKFNATHHFKLEDLGPLDPPSFKTNFMKIYEVEQAKYHTK
jgi:hypothetical protein